MSEDSGQSTPPLPPTAPEQAPDREWVTTVTVKASRPPAEATFTGPAPDER